MTKKETKLTEVRKWLKATEKKAYALGVCAELEENVEMSDNLWAACDHLHNARLAMRKTRMAAMPNGLPEPSRHDDARKTK